jgi:hypothetical protein
MHKLTKEELGNVIPSLRPINSSIGAFNYKLAKYLSVLLNPVIPTDHCATDSFSFVDEIKQIRLDRKYLVSFDVKNLFTNIPLKETIDLAVDMVLDHHKDIKMSKVQMRKLFVFATSHTHFLYDGQYYDQIDGVQMGSPLGPVLANLFMGFHEKTWLTSYNGPKVLYYRRYVDDIFCIFETEEHVAPFLTYLNTQHPNIEFTFEKEVGGNLPFLDVLITKSDLPHLETTTYRKSTYTGLLTNFTSFISMPYKIGLIKTLVDRACKINSTDKTLKSDLTFIQKTLQKNMFPQNILSRFISPNQTTKQPSPSTPVVNESTTRYYKLPYVGKFSAQVKAKIKNLIQKYCKPATDVRLIFTSSKISSYFSLKDAISMHMTPYVVYKFICANCNVCYIGETTKQFIVRVNEHLYTDKASAVYRHLNKDATCKALCNCEAFTIIDRASTDYQLRIKEAFHIQKLQPVLNKQIKSINVELVF